MMAGRRAMWSPCPPSRSCIPCPIRLFGAGYDHRFECWYGVWQVRAAQQVQVEIDKPIGLNFKKSSAKGGGLVVTVRHTCTSALRFPSLGRAPLSHVGRTHASVD